MLGLYVEQLSVTLCTFFFGNAELFMIEAIERTIKYYNIICLFFHITASIIAHTCIDNEVLIATDNDLKWKLMFLIGMGKG